MAPLDMKYDSHMCSSLTNNGRTFCVSVKSDVCNLSGGPLTDKYRLLQFHCHWGSDDSKGAEHTIDGQQHAAELHLVHWNTDKFTSPGDAIKNDKGIAVLTAFIKVGKEHKGWNQVLDHFKEISDVNGVCNMDEDFNPKCLLPENLTDYWTYEGSLTTPPCYESVRFIIFKEVVELSKEQLAQFRSLSTTAETEGAQGDACPKLVDNFRPLQPLNGRIVKASFES
ncbi:putative carbonic anhydrase 2 [Apostichopus japonicus]|uniref:carbonic anhydrase n=1 Tax=Stichopus japonicus TaxID=307972 RepID=A0A2G8KP64_STIJA|nr:putative carbonic anhydrase 2 [Apostichopus japonicus]